MGGQTSKHVDKLAKGVIWCDTEGGVRNVPLWDVTFIEETIYGVSGYRLSNVQQATKRGKAVLRKELPAQVYSDALKTGSTTVTTFDTMPTSASDSKCVHAVVDVPLPKMLASYLRSRASSTFVAWNMNGHDKHVLRRAAGAALDSVTLWDALPWFRARFTLPKNTMGSNKAGTPRALFSVPVFGAAHSSLSDTVHMRDVMKRAAYCCEHDPQDTSCYREAAPGDQFLCVCAEIQESNLIKEWTKVPMTAWIPGLLPKSVTTT